jgi:hypothetical protein
MLRDSKGKKSLTTTLSVIAFVVVMLKVLFGGAAVVVGAFSYSFGEIDAASIAALLGSTLGVYAFRRHTEAAYGYADDEDTGSTEIGPGV